MITTILLFLLAVYFAIAAVFLAMYEGHIEGGWNALKAALSWPALLVVMLLAWKRGDR